MKTPYLDKMIEDLHNHIENVEMISYAGIPETRKELAEYEAIKQALNIASVVVPNDSEGTLPYDDKCNDECKFYCTKGGTQYPECLK